MPHLQKMNRITDFLKLRRQLLIALLVFAIASSVICALLFARNYSRKQLRCRTTTVNMRPCNTAQAACRHTSNFIDQSQIYPLDLPVWIYNYTLLHARALQRPDEQRYLIYKCSRRTGLCGGAGDRLGGMATLFYVAMVTGRIFLVEHIDPFPLQETVVESLVRWSATLPASVARRLNSMDRFDRELAEPSLLQPYNGSIVVQLNRFPEKTIWGSDAMRDYLASFGIVRSGEPPRQLFKWAFHALFRTSSAVQRQIEAMRMQFNLRRSDPFVGMHVRIGGHRRSWTDPPRHSMADLSAFVDCARRMQNVLWGADDGGARHLPIYVASDSAEAKQKLYEMDDAIRTADVVLFHSDRSRSETEELARRGNIESWAELLLLSEANCIVASTSRFDEVAVAISTRGSPPIGRCWAKYNQCGEEKIAEHMFPSGE